MTATLYIDHKPTPLTEDYAIRFYVGNGGIEPTLFHNGKRVTRAWTLSMQATVDDDSKHANANTE